MKVGLGAVVIGLVASACAGTITVSGDLQQAINEADVGGTLTLPAGRYPGPILVDRPLTIVGSPGSVIVGRPGEPALSILNVTGVDIRGVTIEGGLSGIDIRDSEDIVLESVEVRGSELHGIFAHDAQIHVSGCQVSGLTHAMAQGIEIINSELRQPSVIEGCTIYGPVFEGLVVHVSRVEFRDNEVIGSWERGIVITEMSSGTMEGNTVRDAVGAAYFCGDMSRCSVIGNEAAGVADAQDGWKSSGGHGLVVHFHSEAFVEGLSVNDIDGESVLLMIESTLTPVFIEP